MIAKLILNEIKRGKNSALGSIGIGNANVCKFYDKMLKFWPDDVKDLHRPRENNITLAMIERVPIIYDIIDYNKDQLRIIDMSTFWASTSMLNLGWQLAKESDAEPIIANFSNESNTYISKFVINDVPEWNFTILVESWKEIDRTYREESTGSRTYFAVKVPKI